MCRGREGGKERGGEGGEGEEGRERYGEAVRDTAADTVIAAPIFKPLYINPHF